MNLSFNISKDQSSVSNNTRRNLAPFAVHSVKFDGAEIVEGKSKEGTDYKVMYLTFVGADGTAKMPIFFPKDDDGVRGTRESKRDGHTYATPSRWDNNWSIMKQTLEVISPKGYEKFAEVVAKCPGKTQDEKIANIFKYYAEIINKAKGTETNIKLNGYVNQAGYTQLTFPTICAINKEDECFISDNFIGDNVALSDYEVKRAKEFNNAKPTEMKEETPEQPSEAQEESDDIDLSDL